MAWNNLGLARALLKRLTGASWHQLERLRPEGALSARAIRAVRRAIASRVGRAVTTPWTNQWYDRPHLLRELVPPMTYEEVVGKVIRYVGVGSATAAELRRVLPRERETVTWEHPCTFCRGTGVFTAEGIYTGPYEDGDTCKLCEGTGIEPWPENERQSNAV